MFGGMHQTNQESLVRPPLPLHPDQLHDRLPDRLIEQRPNVDDVGEIGMFAQPMRKRFEILAGVGAICRRNGFHN